MKNIIYKNYLKKSYLQDKKKTFMKKHIFYYVYIYNILSHTYEYGLAKRELKQNYYIQIHI